MIEPRRALAASLVAVVTAALGCRASTGATEGLGGADGGATAAAVTSPACTSNAACGAGEHCVFAPGLCGKGKKPGTCQKRPGECHEPRSPVCGCDGKTYGSECEARAAGIDLDVTGACKESIPDWIGCGARFCDARVSYCEIILSDVFELPTDYTCKALPTACRPEGDVARACDCFPKGTKCLSFCGHIETGRLSGFHLTCRL
jgi:hypothetical protein